MQATSTETNGGLYQLYYTQSGEGLIVLEGLSAGDTIEPPYLQTLIHEHYSEISIFYWLLLIITLVYLTGMNIVIPILKRHNLF